MSRLQRLSLPRFPLQVPLGAPALAGLCLLYLFAGLTGHDPWKTDDAFHFAVSYTMLRDGNWLLPHLLGDVVLETPPLYYWVAALFAKLFGGWLPLHDAARLASGMFGAIFLASLALASSRLHGREAGSAAVLIAIGSLGLLVPIHDTQPQIALLAASASFYAALARLPGRTLASGVEAGLSIGLGFLAAGLPALLNLCPLLFLLPARADWRQAEARRGLLIAAAVALPLIAAWPALLAWLAPTAFSAWWSGFGLRPHNQALSLLPAHAELLGWFAWPALPLALWSIWLHRARLQLPGLWLPIVGCATTLLVLLLFYEPRPIPALPLLVPLILLGAAGVGRLRRGATNALDWFAMMTFTLVAALVWLGGCAINLGLPLRIANNFSRLQPGFTAYAGFVPWIIAGAISLCWFWLIISSSRSPWRGITHWAAGITLMWTLVIALWLPWVDYGKSYRSVAVALKQALPAKHQCILERRVGAAQRASLNYFAGIKTVHAEARGAAACDLLLEQGSEKGGPAPAGWQKIWEGNRPGDRGERLRLYRRG